MRGRDWIIVLTLALALAAVLWFVHSLEGQVDAMAHELAVTHGQLQALQEQVAALAEEPCCVQVNVKTKSTLECQR